MVNLFQLSLMLPLLAERNYFPQLRSRCAKNTRSSLTMKRSRKREFKAIPQEDEL